VTTTMMTMDETKPTHRSPRPYTEAGHYARRNSGGLLGGHEWREWREWRAHAAAGALLHALRMLQPSDIAALEADMPEGGEGRRLVERLRLHDVPVEHVEEAVRVIHRLREAGTP
jgi:hypothetical protein